MTSAREMLQDMLSPDAGWMHNQNPLPGSTFLVIFILLFLIGSDLASTSIMHLCYTVAIENGKTTG